MSLSRTVGAIGLAAALAAGAGERATGGIYRCQAPDGSTIFTGDPSRCPGAEAHEPEAEVQRVERSPTAPPATAVRRGGPAPGRDEAARAAVWRTKRRESEARLARVERAIGPVVQALTWCNQGREIWVTDPDTGLRSELSCQQVREDHESLLAERARLRAYLHEGGLEEECRRAGCLPGWIR